MARWATAAVLSLALWAPAEAQQRASYWSSSRIIERRIRAAEARARRTPPPAARANSAPVASDPSSAVADDLRSLAREMGWDEHLDEPRIGRLASLIVHESENQGLPPALVLAVIALESSFVPTARSSAGATGLMQVMPFWPGELKFRFGRDLTDEATNLRYGTWILRTALQEAGGDVSRALLRYNGCTPAAGRPSCFRYPAEVRSRVERFARSTCQARPWQQCVEAPVRTTYDP